MSAPPRGVPEDAAPPAEAERAFAEAVADLRPLVRAVVASALGQDRSHPDVEDCAHEAIRRALEGRARVRAGEPVRPWIVGIARHVATDLLRARGRARARGTAEGDDALAHVADPAPTPSEHLIARERDRAVLAAMEQLPPMTRRALRLFHVEGLGYAEIAARLGVPLGTVATWVSRGRKQMADCLSGRRVP